MSDSALLGYQLRFLRAMGHALRPVVQIGKEGQTDGLIEATRLALLDHELVKVKILSESPVERHEVSDALAKATGSILAQLLGKTFLLYKRHPQKPRIQLPKKASKKSTKRSREAALDVEPAKAAPPGEAAPRDARRSGPKKAGAAADSAPAARGARRAYSAHMKGASRRNRRATGR